MKKLLLILLCTPMIGFGQACNSPNNIFVSDTTYSSFSVNFDVVVNADYYRIKYRKVGSGTNWILVHIGSDTSITINNLDIATSYEYKIRTYCNSGTNSSWSSTYQITTLHIYGCIDDRALNYNPFATLDNGDCNFSCLKNNWARNISNVDYNSVNFINTDLIISYNFLQSGTEFMDSLIFFNGGVGGNQGLMIGSINSKSEKNWILSTNNFNISSMGGITKIASLKTYNDNIYLSILSNLSSFTFGNQLISGMVDDGGSGVLSKIRNGNVEYMQNISQEAGFFIGAIDESQNIFIHGSNYASLLNINHSLPWGSNDPDYYYLQKLDSTGILQFTKYLISSNLSGYAQSYSSSIPQINNSVYLSLLLTNWSSNDICLWSESTYVDTLDLVNFNQVSSLNNYLVTLKFSTSGTFLDYYDNSSVRTPNQVFTNNLLNITGDTIFELDTTNLNIIGTHIYPGLINIQIEDDQMILTVGSEMLLVDTNFITIDTIDVVGFYNDGAVYIHNDGGLIGDTVITATGLNMAKYDIYPINPNQEPVTCINWTNGSVNVNPTLGIPPYSYNWNTGDTTAQIDQLGIGIYSVTVTDSIGCINTDSIQIQVDVAPSDSMNPEICYVTVDVNTGYNKIILSPLESPLTSQYIIYKEGSATLYTPMDTIDANTLEYVDTNSNPTIQANRYKVSAIDACGNISNTSDHHKTVHLTMNSGTNGEVNLIWNLYEGYQVSDYLIYRGNSASNMNMIATISGNLSSFTDQTPPTGSLEYQIRAIGQICNSIPNALILPDTLESNVITHVNQLNMNVSIASADPSCPNCSDGYAIANAYGGLPPYSYVWTNGNSGAFLNNLSAGTYTVFAFDNAGNQATESVTLGSTLIISGCTDPTANNYDPTATIDDGSCTYPSICTEPTPTGLFVSNIVHNRVTINWDNMNDANCTVDQYRIKYREVGTNSWSQKNMGTPLGSCTWACNKTDKLILGLNPGTTYEYQIKAWYCGAENSSWSDLNTFTTLDACPNIGNLTVSTPNSTKATFNWDASNGNYEFVRIKSRVDSISNPSNADWFNVGGAGVSYPTFTKNKNNLTPGETYRAQARTWCDPNGGPYKSDTWTPLVYWTQPTIRIDGGESIVNLEVYPNPSKDVFNISFTSESIQDLRVRVISIVGEELMIEDLQQFIGEYTKKVSLNENAKGIYFLEIETKDGIINKKLILQ
ncbi:fibronectin type III domain-containing protein [Flavobacteriales bacterium]|nr:fibronectin type III domain-containing protein [Flavobacteriales bacterium]